MARSNKQPTDEAAIDQLSFEQAMAELEEIIERIEQGRIGLEESLAQRRRGDLLVKRCRAVLDAAEQELQQVRPGEGSDESK